MHSLTVALALQLHWGMEGRPGDCYARRERHSVYELFRCGIRVRGIFDHVGRWTGGASAQVIAQLCKVPPDECAADGAGTLHAR